jgi:hypothetical protein
MQHGNKQCKDTMTVVMSVCRVCEGNVQVMCTSCTMEVSEPIHASMPKSNHGSVLHSGNWECTNQSQHSIFPAGGPHLSAISTMTALVPHKIHQISHRGINSITMNRSNSQQSIHCCHNREACRPCQNASSTFGCIP